MSFEQRLGRRQADMETYTRLAKMETLVEALHRELLGNGQPGALARIHIRIDDLDAAVENLNGWRKWVHGIAVAVGTVITGLAAVLAWTWEYLHSKTS